MSFVTRGSALGEAVLLELVPELTEGHAKELGRLGLYTAGTIQRALEIATLEVVESRLQVQALLRDVHQLGTARRALAPDRLGQGLRPEHVAPAQDDCALEHVLQLPDVAGPMVTFQDGESVRRDAAHVLAQILAEL